MNPNAQPNSMPGATAQSADNIYNVGPPSVTKDKPLKQAYLPTTEYAWTYYEAQKQARLFFLPFNEYERIAQNKIREDLPPNMPRVNDGSLSGLLNETPMRILAQPFTGNAVVTESVDPETSLPTSPQPWLTELINVLWNREIIPYANMEAPFFQKQVLALYRALVYGSCPIYDFFTNRNGRRTVDFVLPYIRDVYLEVGKHSDLDSDYIFMDQYYTRLQVDKILAAGNKIEATGVKSPWNLKALKQIRDSHVESQKEYLAKNPSERNRPVRSTQIKFTTVFQRGVNAPFDTFYAEGNKEDVVIVKGKTNEDPTGDLPIHFLYAYSDLFNPYGKGQIELSGGTQNVLDYMTQTHVLANQVGLQPPILIEGDRSSTDLDSMIYAPTQYWFTGNAKVSMMETSSGVLKEFPTAYGLYKNQLINMQGTSTTDLVNESEDPSKGKTPAAINTQTDRQNSHDNYLLNQTVDTFSRVFKSMLNIYFANMQGSTVVKLEADDAVRMMRVGMIPSDPKTGQPVTQQLELEWNKLRGKFDFQINPDSSRKKSNMEQVEHLENILTFIQENPYMLQYIRSTGFDLNIGEVYSEIITHLDIQNTEKILTPLTPQEKAQAMLIPPMVFDKPSIQMHFPDIPAVAQMQLLNRLGLNVSLMDVLMGPVLDPNIRGVFQPEPQPGQPNNPVPETPQQQPGQPPIPPSPEGEDILAKGATFAQDPGRPPMGGGAPMAPPAAPPAPAGPGQPSTAPQKPLDPKTIALVKQTMAENGVPAQVALGIIHARAMGLPENEIQQWLDKHNVGKKVAGAASPA